MTCLRRCSAVWSERTLTATGCDHVAVRRFRRVGKDLRPHDVWLCAACAALRRRKPVYVVALLLASLLLCACAIKRPVDPGTCWVVSECGDICCKDSGGGAVCTARCLR